MKQYRLLLPVIALLIVLTVSALNGCDKRSQFEKDTDKAADKVNRSMR
jgi:hypothetical protein